MAIEFPTVCTSTRLWPEARSSSTFTQQFMPRIDRPKALSSNITDPRRVSSRDGPDLRPARGLQVHSVLQEAGLSDGLAGALARQRDSRAFTAAARALFPVPSRPRVPDTTVPWPAPRSEGEL